MAVVILDEMDQLLSQDHSVLYDLFRLPQASTSHHTTRIMNHTCICQWRLRDQRISAAAPDFS